MSRNVTLANRHRKNALFEQEHAASRDFDTQRSGGTPSKQPGKKEKSAQKKNAGDGAKPEAKEG